MPMLCLSAFFGDHAQFNVMNKFTVPQVQSIAKPWKSTQDPSGQP